jgi:tight adherence protein C
VMAVKCGAALVAALLVVPLAAGLPGRLGPLAVTCAPAAGFLAPDLWLRRRARARAGELARELPDVLDLLRVAVDAGLPAGRALAEVGRRRAGLLGRELRTTARELALGVPSTQALEDLAARCPVEGVIALVAALQRAERHGTPLGEPLAALAAEARAQRARALLDAAARAAPKIQLVVALLLVPAVMLLVAAALVDALAR